MIEKCCNAENKKRVSQKRGTEKVPRGHIGFGIPFSSVIQVVLLLIDSGIITLREAYLDGTIIEANANRSRAHTHSFSNMPVLRQVLWKKLNFLISSFSIYFHL